VALRSGVLCEYMRERQDGGNGMVGPLNFELGRRVVGVFWLGAFQDWAVVGIVVQGSGRMRKCEK
jgi:hypothetical protein